MDCNSAVTNFILFISVHLNLSLLYVQYNRDYKHFSLKIIHLEFSHQFRPDFPPSFSSKNIQISEVFLHLNQ